MHALAKNVGNSLRYLFVFRRKPALATIPNESGGLFICNRIHALRCSTYGPNYITLPLRARLRAVFLERVAFA